MEDLQESISPIAGTSPLAEGTLLDSRYEIGQLLGAGGMGWVLEVRDQQFGGQILALKILYPHLMSTNNAFVRFQNEVSITRRLSHPAIVQSFGFGKTKDGLAYVVMEYVEGCSLKQMIAQNQTGLSLASIEKTLLQVLEGLCFAHNKGIIHRDLKPDNILLSPEGVAKIADFGMAQTLRQESHLTQAGAVVGTPLYMSPEQILGEPLTRQSDIYSLGIMAFEMTAGIPPFQGETFFEIGDKHLKRSLPSLPVNKSTRPLWLKELIEKCSMKVPEERFDSVDEIRALVRYHASTYLTEFSENISTAVPLEAEREHSIKSKLRFNSSLSIIAIGVLIAFAITLSFARINRNFNSEISRLFLSLEKRTGWQLGPVRDLLAIRKNLFDPKALFKEDYRTLEKFLRTGLDPNQVNPDTGEYLLHDVVNKGDLASRTDNLLQTLIDSGAQVDVRDRRGFTPLHNCAQTLAYERMGILLSAGADPNLRDRKGRTPLVLSVQHGDFRSSALLLLFGANPNLSLWNGRSPLHIATLDGRPKIIRLLLHKMADPNQQDKHGRPPLLLLIAMGSKSSHFEKVLSILAPRTDLEIKDKFNINVFDYAKENKDEKTLAILEKARRDKQQK